MKRLSLLVLFFYVCAFAQPRQAQANPVIGILAPGVIGATILVMGSTYYAKKNPSSSYSSDGYSVTTSLWAYNKIYQKGVETLIGKPVVAALDLKRAYDRGVLKAYSALEGVLYPLFASTDPSAPTSSSVVDHSSFDNMSDTQCYKVTNLQYQYGTPKPICNPNAVINNCYQTRYIWYKELSPTDGCSSRYMYYDAIGTKTNDPVNYPPPPVAPEQLDPQYVSPGSQAIANAAANDQAVAQDLDNLLEDHPEVWVYPDAVKVPVNPQSINDYPPAQPITGTDINQWAQGQSAAAQQEYIDNLEDLVAANPDNAELQAELERAKAEQAQQEADEVADTFDPISVSPFGEAYTPGEFDIPARFTAFLNNVKSSSLFSFSSAFFNSLPGGGSPVYEIEAGQYGHHSIDLSQTMTAGLAVLKTVLMLCFGFLSIRAVIMKR